MVDWLIYGGIAGALTSVPVVFKYISNSITIKDEILYKEIKEEFKQDKHKAKPIKTDHEWEKIRSEVLDKLRQDKYPNRRR